jgi:hypothetical protein
VGGGNLSNGITVQNLSFGVLGTRQLCPIGLLRLLFEDGHG